MDVTLTVVIEDLSDGADPELVRRHIERVIDRELLEGSCTVTVSRETHSAYATVTDDDLAFARETLGADATDNEVLDLAQERVTRDTKERN
jgi:hypothetical protein